MNKPLCLIMLGGEAPGPAAAQDLRALLDKESPCVVAADSGADHLWALGLTPQLLVGDSDSLSAQTQAACREAGVEWLPLPREKNFTDGEAALCAALNAGYRRIAVFGAFGGKPDHLLGNLLLPLAYREQWDELIFYGEDYRAWYCFGETQLTGAPGDTVSLVALSAAVENITLRGFRYPLLEYNTVLGSSRCLRNELAEREGRVTFDNGIMLVIHYRGRMI